MTPMTGFVEARALSDFEHFISHPGPEFIFVLSGVVDVHTKAQPSVRLPDSEGALEAP